MDKKEYIERKEVNSEINKLPLTEDATMEILWAIDDIPTDDVAPVVHGYWAKEKTDVIVSWKCSACCNCYYLDEPNAKYCPNCGAKMDGKDNDSNE